MAAIPTSRTPRTFSFFILSPVAERTPRKSGPYLIRLYSDVVRAMEETVGARRPSQRRSVMTRLREFGYNADICKVKWESSDSSLTADSYDYINVLPDDNDGMCVVDVEFASEFDMARATKDYWSLVVALPRVMVGRGEDGKRTVRTMAEVAKRSMKSKGLHLLPWRKRRYMLAKFFGPYRRTINVVPASSAGAPAAITAVGETVQCRAIGFAVVEPERVLLAQATRTR